MPDSETTMSKVPEPPEGPYTAPPEDPPEPDGVLEPEDGAVPTDSTPTDSAAVDSVPVDFAEEAVIGSVDPAAISTLEDTPPVVGAVGGSGRRRIGDRIFAGAAGGAGGLVILLVILVGVFLIWQAIPAIRDDKSGFFSDKWNVTENGLHFGVGGLLWVTVIISAIAMIIAVPIALGIALFMTQYAPKRLARPIGYVIDLLAAIPSIIYGIWGVTVLSPKLEPVQRALYHLGGFPIFKNEGFLTGSIFDGGVVLAIMVLPIITAISRDVFERTPRANIEAALALGATRWEMIRMAVLPYGRAGVVSGSMLGLGRALGETIAIYLILKTSSAGFNVSIFNGGSTFASKIAADSAEFGNTPGPYIAAGLVLFVLTFVVNAAARAVVNRKKEFS